jgi:hypothetical protein
MAEFKRRKLILSNGKHVRLFGNSMAIGPNLEIGEGYAPNILSVQSDQNPNKATPEIFNPQKLTQEELQELADYNIRLWMELKENLRKFGVSSSKLFGEDLPK